MSSAVIVPIHKKEFTDVELISLQQLEKHLDGYPRISIQPAGLSVRLSGFELCEFPIHHFTCGSAYSKLLLSPYFYEVFASYEYVLVYQLDCLVFSNDLLSWCNMGYDYIGAPLFKKNSHPPRPSRVGNGGLSLRRVQAFIDVLHSTHIPPWGKFLTANLPDIKQIPLPMRWLKKIKIIRDARRGVRWYTKHYSLNEDLFWSDRAKLFNPGFKIAPMDVALRFAFDAHPRICYEKNGHQLPFGAHAWNKWDRPFWEQYLLK